MSQQEVAPNAATADTQVANDPLPLASPSAKSSSLSQLNPRPLSSVIINRLSNIAPKASKESIQTLARWIVFHFRSGSSTANKSSDDNATAKSNSNENQLQQRYNKVIYDALLHSLSTSIQNEHPNKSTTVIGKKTLVYLSIIQEMCISHSSITLQHDESKWNRNSSIRSDLGEFVLRPFLEFWLDSLQNVIATSTNVIHSHSATTMTDCGEYQESMNIINSMKDVWVSNDCFHSELLLDELKKLIRQIILSVGKIVNSTNNDSMTNLSNSSMVNNEQVTMKQESQNDGPTTTISDNGRMNIEEVKDNMIASDELDTTNIDKKSGNKEQSKITNHNNDTNMNLKDSQDIDEIESSEQNEPSQSTPIPSDTEDIFMVNDDDDDDNDGKSDVEQKTNDKQNGQNIEKDDKSPRKSDISSAGFDIQEFDFESEGIPFAKVDINELLSSIKSLATMQITRDLRSETAHNISSIVSTAPPEVLSACENATTSSIPMDLLPSIPDDILDLDIDEAISNVRLHKDIISKLSEARLESINLLIKSRCEFGSSDAAIMFYSLDDIFQKLQKKKNQIVDAMELEGLDFEENGDDGEKNDEDTLKEFSWCTRDEALRDHAAKRMKLGE